VDINYTVVVDDSTASQTLYRQHGINVTEISYPLTPDKGCDDLVFTVIPVNAAGEGVSNSIPLSQAIERENILTSYLHACMCYL
jgi:hypothetical protein